MKKHQPLFSNLFYWKSIKLILCNLFFLSLRLNKERRKNSKQNCYPNNRNPICLPPKRTKPCKTIQYSYHNYQSNNNPSPKESRHPFSNISTSHKQSSKNQKVKNSRSLPLCIQIIKREKLHEHSSTNHHIKILTLFKYVSSKHIKAQ